MFWSLILEPGKKYSSTINDGFHLSMAALDVNTAKTPNEVYPVLLKINGKDTVLCNLSKPQFLQVNLDHMFEKGSKVTFFTTGKATIHLTGYLVHDDFDSSEFSDDDSSEVSDASSENVSDLFDKKGKGDSKAASSKKNKRKLMDVVGEEIAKKKSKPKGNEADEKGVDMSMNTLNHKSLDSSGDEDDDDDDDIDLSSEDLDSDNLKGGEADSDDSDDEDEDDDGDDDDDDDDSDDSDEDESDDTEINKAKMQKAQKTPQQTPKKKPEEKTPNQGKNAQKQQTPTSNKKQNKQNQSLLNGAATPKSDKKNNKGTPQQNNKGTPQPQQKQGGSPQKRTLAGGVHVEDIRVVDGPVAKPGKTVAVLYTGRLKSNNRVFDQTMKGSGFKFRLGKGEVIKGWDVGVAGMTVGSKRRIICPPAMAYGKEGSMPEIPPNATLVFDVELKNVE